MVRRQRLADRVSAGAPPPLALALSPVVVRTVTGRADLPLGVSAVCWALGLVLLALVDAVLSPGRAWCVRCCRGCVGRALLSKASRRSPTTLGSATLASYGDAVAAGLPGLVDDLSDVVDESAIV